MQIKTGNVFNVNYSSKKAKIKICDIFFVENRSITKRFIRC